MKKLRIRESKVEAFMKKRGYRDIYEMKDKLLVAGYEPERAARSVCYPFNPKKQ